MTLPVLDQLVVQLAKCKSVRDMDYNKSREKTPQEIEAAKAKLPQVPQFSGKDSK